MGYTKVKAAANTVLVVGVDRYGCTVAINGTNKHISWPALDEPEQDQPELAQSYRAIGQQAWTLVEGNRSLPITCSVHQDETRVWWVASFCDVAGRRGWISRAAHEGGTHAHAWLAQQEADDRAKRLRRMGYTVDGDA